MIRIVLSSLVLCVIAASFAWGQEPCPGCNTIQVGTFTVTGTSSGDDCPCPDTPPTWTDCSYTSRVFEDQLTHVFDPYSEPLKISGITQSHWVPFKKIEYQCACIEGNHRCTIIDDEVDVIECIECP